MARAGIEVVIEPAFWIGQPRTNAGSFLDYFSSLVNWEPFRASQFGVRHFCAIGLNAKEANNETLAQEVIELIPRYAGKDNVVAIGEIGFDEITKAEETALIAQIGIAKDLNMLILIHTPHRDKKTGTIVRQYGAERILVDSSADWGVSDPLAVPKTAALMLKKGIPREAVIKTCYQNALMAYAPSGVIHEAELLRPKAVDWDQLYEGNSVLRGQKPQDINDLMIQ
jgi:predicted metal-dependent TIM-barrel fold hydrolase